MSSLTEPEKANIRAYLGFGALFHDSEPRLENAMTAIAAVADGGSLPDDSTVLRVRSILTKISAIETQIEGLYCKLVVIEAGTERVKLNATRAIGSLRSEGRRIVGQLAIVLSTSPVRDYFGEPDLRIPGESPFPEGSW